MKSLPDPSLSERPIFIGGPDRCGKTTLQAFLSSHPRIAIPPVGSNLWSYFYNQFGDLSQEANFERCLEELIRYKHARPLQPDLPRLRNEFWQGSPNYARLFGLLHAHYAERLGKPRWGDQTGLIERYADQIFAAFPNARILHMIRDPRDRYEASLEMWPEGKGRAGMATTRWLYSSALARRNQVHFPGRYLLVHFENLVMTPEPILREICEFVGEEFTPLMLAMDASPGHRDKLSQAKPGNSGTTPLSPDYIGRYRQGISRQEIVFIQEQARRYMQLFQYPLDTIHFSARERIVYELLTRPTNLARLTGWLVREYFQQRFPGLFRRRPSQKMLLVSTNSALGTASNEPRKNA